MRKPILLLIFLFASGLACQPVQQEEKAGQTQLKRYTVDESRFVIRIVDPSAGKLKFYWKDHKGKILGSFENLKQLLDGNKSTLVFATNGGMYNMEQAPQGLFIEKVVLSIKLTPAKRGVGTFICNPMGFLA